MKIRGIRPVLVLLLIVLAFAVGREIRDWWGIELSVELLRKWVADFGWKAPAVYLAVVVLRPFLLVPSAILLPAGGACFGLTLGTVLGAIGVTLSALIQFWLAQRIGRESVQRRFGASLARVRRQIEAAGPLLVGAVTAHPTGPMTAFHWGAALASIPVVPFTAAVLAGASARSFLYSFFGASLDDPSSLRFWVSTALLLAFFLLPVAHPEVRGRLFGRTSDPPAAEDS